MNSGGQYARGTQVPIEQTQMEIARTLKRYRASSVKFEPRNDCVVLAFKIGGTPVRIDCPMPVYGTWPLFDEEETERRRRWRALGMIVKAKLEAVSSGISTVESEFMAHVVQPDGYTPVERLALPAPKAPDPVVAPKKPSLLRQVVRELSRPKA